MTNIAEYEKKIFNNISKLKEIWKNNYKDNVNRIKNEKIKKSLIQLSKVLNRK